MQPDAIKPEPEDESPGANVKAPTTTNQANGRPATGKAAQNGTSNGQFPPPKTDKPRPHVCTTCGRSFARLEHLKRHERSHTKEKPFECPECTRCFARRDLLLRHQQKLHMTNATTRPRQGRRESVGGPGVNGNSKVRKNSVANANVGGAAGNIAQGRPRANTISHIDMASLGIFDGNNPHVNRLNALGLTGLHGGHMGMNRIPGAGNFDYRGMSTAIGLHGNIHGLPKLDTHINNMDMSNSLQTAPPRANFGGFDIDQLFTPHTTINPAALHFGGAGSIQSSNIPFGFDPSTNQQVPIDDDFTWMRNWNMQLGSGNDNDQAIDESSPSRVSSGDSPGDFPENMSNSQTAMPIRHNSYQWPQHEMQQQQNIPGGPFQLEALGTGLPILESANGTISPSSLHDPTPTGDAYFHQAMMQQPGQQTHHQHLQSLSEIMHSQNGATTFGHALSNFDSNSPSIASSSMAGSARQSSVTSMSTDSITDSTRQALLSSLAQPSVLGGHNHRKYSQPSVSSPLSPAARSNMHSQGPNLPGTADIKRYIEAFIHFAHPHLPIAHLATLSFDVIETNSVSRGSPPSTTSSQNAFTGGARCLILGMAAIGALYEYDHPASKDLFEAAKKMIQLYLEERRKADISAAANGSNAAGETPLWLVQAMLLTVIYGHHCGDRIAADIASNHIAALVSLARAAHLAQPRTEGSPSTTGEGLGTTQSNGDVDMGGHTATNGTSNHETDLHTQWIKWKTGEERKRCLFAIFILSSLLTTAYNQTPTIMNSEILLDLPCAEELYEARSAEEWQARGGLAASEASSISFASALSFLLTASQRQGNNFAPSAYNSCSETGALQSGEEELKPSTFGCHVLINALHNYIWETRSRHTNKDWTVQETESMVTNIEPALNAWQVAWKANKQHRLERPNPYGCGPLSADSIPLLDLAFVRLYVNLGRTAEAFWRRDFDQMAEELAGGGECEGGTSDRKARMGPASAKSSPAALRGAPQLQGDDDQASTRRERHLRKAAYYSADALTIACSYNMTYADPTAHELPIQSAICFFDCTQVLAEWCTTIQERAGRYLGILGRDEIDYSQVPAIMLLENEDVELLRKIESICNSLEEKRMQQENLLMMDPQHGNGTTASLTNGVDLSSCGLGSKVLRVTAMMLEKAVIWPITHVMAKALETEASHMDRRAAASCTQ